MTGDLALQSVEQIPQDSKAMELVTPVLDVTLNLRLSMGFH
jgi:hypothetical protein